MRPLAEPALKPRPSADPPLPVQETYKIVGENCCLIRNPLRIIPSTLGEQPKLMWAPSLILASNFAIAQAG